MKLAERIGSALVNPRRALAAAATGQGGMPDALLLVLLKILCTETRVLVVTLWMMVKVGPQAAVAGLSSRLTAVVGLDLLLLAGGGIVVTLGAGQRRDATRDFDLAAVAWIPVLFLDVAATACARVAGVNLAGAPERVVQILMLGVLAHGCVLAVRATRGETDAQAVERSGRTAGLALLGVLAALLAWNAVDIARNVRELAPRGQGDVAPALALRPVDPAGPKSLAELRGKVVLVDFWATWCAPCRRSMPAIEKIWTRYRDAGFTVVSINIENDAAKARTFAERFQPRLDFPLFVDAGAAMAAYRVENIPQIVLIDRAGRIDLVHVGGFDADDLAERVEALTKAELPAPSSSPSAPGG